MPLSSPAGGGAEFPTIAALLQVPLYSAGLGSNVSGTSSFTWRTMSRWNGTEIFIGATTSNRLWRLTDLRNGKLTQLGAVSGGTIGIGAVSSPIRAINGDIWAIVESAGLRDIVRSTDNGATWADIANPAAQLDIAVSIVQTANGRIWLQSNGGANNLHFTDNNGATWTTIPNDTLGGGGTNRGGLLVSRDGDILIGTQPGGVPSQYFFITDISGSPPTINNFDWNTIFGGSGETCSNYGCCFSILNNTAMLYTGDFGGLYICSDITNPGLANTVYINDNANPLIRGNDVGATTLMFTAYDPINEGWLVFAPNGGGAGPQALFLPEANPAAFSVITGQSNGNTAGRNTFDDVGNYLSIITNVPNLGYKSFVQTLA